MIHLFRFILRSVQIQQVVRLCQIAGLLLIT